MADTNVVTIIEQLQSEEASLAASLDKLRTLLSRTEGELARVQAAKKALQPKTTKRRSGGKKAPTRDDVTGTITAVVSQRGQLALEELKSSVAKQLASRGFSKVGYALRFKEAVAELRLVKQPTDQQTNTNREGRQIADGRQSDRQCLRRRRRLGCRGGATERSPCSSAIARAFCGLKRSGMTKNVRCVRPPTSNDRQLVVQAESQKSKGLAKPPLAPHICLWETTYNKQRVSETPSAGGHGGGRLCA